MSNFENNINFLDRLLAATKLAIIHITATIAYGSIGFLIMFVGLVFSESLTASLFWIVLGYLFIIIGLFAATIFTLSNSKFFVCKIGFLQAMGMAVKLIFEISIAFIITMIIPSLLANEAPILALFLLLLLIITFPIIEFYYVMEWIFENKDNPTLSNNFNQDYQGRLNQHSPQPTQMYQFPSYTNPQQPPDSKMVNDSPSKNQEFVKGALPTEVPDYCPECGAKTKKSEKFEAAFCSKCGTQLRSI